MFRRPQRSRYFPSRALAAMVALATAASVAYGTTPAELSSGYTTQAGTPAQPARGQQFFSALHGRDWSCSSCHGAAPVQGGRHAATGKPIAPLAPAANPNRFTDNAKAEKWFRRNCNDVLGRDCTATEKADVLAWLITLKP